MERPNINTVDKGPAIHEIAKRINKWCSGETPLDEIEKDLRDIFTYKSHNEDGYELAKSLENKGYSSDSELVDLLEGVFFVFRSFEEKAVKRWVKDNDVQPLLGLSQTVKIPMERYKPYDQEMTGVITSIDFEEAKYTVCIEALGHVEEGVGIHGTIYNFEKLEAAQ